MRLPEAAELLNFFYIVLIKKKAENRIWCQSLISGQMEYLFK